MKIWFRVIIRDSAEVAPTSWKIYSDAQNKKTSMVPLLTEENPGRSISTFLAPIEMWSFRSDIMLRLELDFICYLSFDSVSSILHVTRT
jgi:hypothetical protein